jgi:RND superfamily putative drug exporter
MFTSTPDSVTGEQVLAQHFAAGAGAPAVVISTARSADSVRRTVLRTAGTASATAPVIKNGYAYLEATLASPPDSRAAKSTVDRLRTAVHAIDGADATVGGRTAVVLDTQRAAQHDNKVIIPLVLCLVLIGLALLLRAVVAALLLTATVVLSFAAALGVSSLVFAHVFHFAGEDSTFPLLVFVFLVALGIDYNIFLMTRVREEAQQHGTRGGVLVGLAATGGVITSAGLVLAATFAVLGTLPVVAYAEIGFAVCLGVLLDTLVVRSILVTALSMDIGRHTWWPSAMSRPPGVPEEPVPTPAAMR